MREQMINRFIALNAGNSQTWSDEEMKEFIQLNTALGVTDCPSCHGAGEHYNGHGYNDCTVCHGQGVRYPNDVQQKMALEAAITILQNIRSNDSTGYSDTLLFVTKMLQQYDNTEYLNRQELTERITAVIDYIYRVVK